MSRHNKTFAPRTNRSEAQITDIIEEQEQYVPISSQDATISLAKTEVTQITYGTFRNRAFNKVERGSSIIQFSDRGLHVSALNRALTEFGYTAPENKTLFWNETKIGLINFQRKNGITPTGIFNKETLLKMNEALETGKDEKMPFQEKEEGTPIVPNTNPPDEKVSISVGVVPMKIKSNKELFEYLDIQIFGRIVDAQWDIGKNSYKDYIGKETNCEVSISSLKKHLGITDEQWEDMYKKKTSGKSNASELRESVKKHLKKVKDRKKEMEALSSNRKSFIREATSSIDYIQNIRIHDLLKQLSDEEITDYNSKVSKETTNLGDIEASLKAYIETRDKNRENKDELETVKTKLYGLEEFYKEYRRYVDYLKNSASNSTPIFSSPSSNNIDLSPILVIPDRQEELDKKAKQHGFKDLTDFENWMKKYLAAFRYETVRIAEDYIDKYEHLLYEEEKRLKQGDVIKQLYAAFYNSEAGKNISEGNGKKRNALMMVNRFGSKEIEAQKIRMYDEGEKEKTTGINKIKTLDSPLFKDKVFDFDKLGDVNSQTDFEKVLLNFIESNRENAHKVRQDLKDNPDAVFKQQDLLQYSYQQQEIAENSIIDLIIQQEISDIQWTQALIGIGLALAAIISMVVTWGASTPYVAAGAAVSLGISTYSVYEALDQYYKEDAAYEIGLLKDKPSLVWVVVAIAGAALDAAGLAAVFKAAKPITEAAELFNKSAKSAEDIKILKASLKKIEKLDTRVQQNIVRQAELTVEFRKASLEFLKASSILNSGGFASLSELIRLAGLGIKRGITTFEGFLLELKLNKIINSVNNLTDEELKTLKEAFLKAKNSTSDEEKIAKDISKAEPTGDFSKKGTQKGKFEQTEDIAPGKLPYGEVRIMEVKTIRFMQSSISNPTGDYFVLENAYRLYKGEKLPTSNIKVWYNTTEDAQGLWTVDHRRLAAYKIAGRENIKIEYIHPDELMVKNTFKMTTKTQGTDMDIFVYLDENGKFIKKPEKGMYGNRETWKLIEQENGSMIIKNEQGKTVPIEEIKNYLPNEK